MYVTQGFDYARQRHTEACKNVQVCFKRGCIHAPHMPPFHIKANPLQSKAGWSFHNFNNGECAGNQMTELSRCGSTGYTTETHCQG